MFFLVCSELPLESKLKTVSHHGLFCKQIKCFLMNNWTLYWHGLFIVKNCTRPKRIKDAVSQEDFVFLILHCSSRCDIPGWKQRNLASASCGMCLLISEGSDGYTVITKWSTKHRVFSRVYGTGDGVEQMRVIACEVLGELATAAFIASSPDLLPPPHLDKPHRRKQYFPEFSGFWIFTHAVPSS